MSFEKMLKQVEHKPAKVKRMLKHNKPKNRKYGRVINVCVRCGSHAAFINKYGLHLCRKCFREVAKELGFKKYGHEV